MDLCFNQRRKKLGYDLRGDFIRSMEQKQRDCPIARPAIVHQMR
jgi:hypothetical protein